MTVEEQAELVTALMTRVEQVTLMGENESAKALIEAGFENIFALTVAEVAADPAKACGKIDGAAVKHLARVVRALGDAHMRLGRAGVARGWYEKALAVYRVALHKGSDQEVRRAEAELVQMTMSRH